MRLTEQNVIVTLSDCELCGELEQCRRVADPTGIVWTLCDECNPELQDPIFDQCELTYDQREAE